MIRTGYTLVLPQLHTNSTCAKRLELMASASTTELETAEEHYQNTPERQLENASATA